MKIPNQLKLFILSFLFLTILNCKERETETNPTGNFCTIQRVFYSNIDNKIGTLIYNEERNKFAIKYYPNLPTIDEVHFYFLCEKPADISVNDSVKFSCKLFKFNSSEGYNPTVGGTEFYFANDLTIIKTQ
jgi:hypothetical protein